MYASAGLNSAFTLGVKRGDEVIDIAINPVYDSASDKNVVGITYTYAQKSFTVLQGLALSFNGCF